jgi:hypothetical protein
MLRVLTAGSKDQSARLEMLEVVARGVPFRRSSVPPAVVRVAPSRQIRLVLKELIVPTKQERKLVSTSLACKVLIVA